MSKLFWVALHGALLVAAGWGILFLVAPGFGPGPDRRWTSRSGTHDSA